MEVYNDQVERTNTIREHVEELFQKATDQILERLSFMSVATERIKLVYSHDVDGVSLRGNTLYYEPSFILKKNIEDSNAPLRILLHTLCHAVFVHTFKYGRPTADLWDLACDIAIENLIIDLGIPDFALASDRELMQSRTDIKRYSTDMTAENIYRFFLTHPPSEEERAAYRKVFTRDTHYYHKTETGYEESLNIWQRISDRIKIELKVFSKNSGRGEIFMDNLNEATRPRYNYRKTLERFCKEHDGVSVSDDEFDYIYYTYGITHYDGMPFVEPMELTKGRNVKDYAIVLDTTSFCPAEVIKTFLRKTVDIIKSENRYSENVDFHIIQSDYKNNLTDTVLREMDDINAFIDGITGGFAGGSDFKPAFEYMESLLYERVFSDFRGMIYFTDGFGTFPGKNPGYSCIFAFVTGRFKLPEVPWWVTPIVLDEDALS